MKNLLACLFLIVLGALVFGLVLRGYWGNPTPSMIKNTINDTVKPYGIAPDRGRFLLTQNLVERHSFALNQEQADGASPDVGYYKGNYFIYFAPGISVFAIPFYMIGARYNLSQVSTNSMGVLFGIAGLIFVYLISKKILNLPVWASLFASLVFGFASTALSYTTSMYQHQTTAFFVLSSFYAVYQYRLHKKWGFLWGLYVWTAYALAITLDYPNALLLLPIMVYFLIASISNKAEGGKYKIKLRTSIIFTSIFFLAITFIHGYYNYYNFGGWTKLSGGLIGYNVIKNNNLDKGNIEENAKKITALAGKKDVSSLFREQTLVNSSYELLVAPDKGIFIFNPIFLLGILGILYALKKLDLEKAVLISIIIVNIFFYSSWGDPWGGWAFGPRYLIPCMPVLAIFVSYCLVSVRFKLLTRMLAFILFVFSAGVSLLGALTTNAVPPKVEAVFLHSKYGFPFAIKFLTDGITSNFAYNNFFIKKMSLVEYWAVLLGIVSITAFVVLFILPLFKSRSATEEEIIDKEETIDQT